MSGPRGVLTQTSDELDGLGAVAAAAADCRVASAHAVPGYPITELAEALFSVVGGGWATNEKVAMGLALGGSAIGRRRLVVAKQVGGNVLLDPLVAAAYQGVTAGVVVVLGDDPYPRMTIHPQDSRWLGAAAGVPVLDPPDPPKAYASVDEAFALSEDVRMPVILRVTPRMLKSRGWVTRSPGPAPPRSPQSLRASWEMTWRGKAQRLHYHAWPKAERRAGSKLLNRESPGGSTGFISTGASDELVRQLEGGFAHLSLTYVHPMPRQMVDAFLAEHQTVIAVEEPGCFLESMLGGRVLGKLTWHLPFGELSTEDLRRAVALARSGGRLPTPEPDLFGDRRPGERICNDCPFALVYTRLAELKTPVVGDQGCTTYAAFPPLSAIDLLYDLGSSTSVAAGIGPGALAVTGDYALLHSGLAGLLDAVHNLRTLKVLVLTNGCSALTGGQPTPDLHGVVSAIVADTEAIPVWEFDVERVKRKLEEPGVWVQFVLGDCGRRRRKAP